MSETEKVAKPKRVVKKVILNYVHRQVVFNALESVYKEGASSLGMYRINKVRDILKLDELAEWETDRMNTLQEMYNKWDKDERKGPVPTLSDEQAMGDEEDFILDNQVFKFIQDFLSKCTKYSTRLCPYVVRVNEIFGIVFEDDDNIEYEDIVEEVTKEDHKIVKE